MNEWDTSRNVPAFWPFGHGVIKTALCMTDDGRPLLIVQAVKDGERGKPGEKAPDLAHPNEAPTLMLSFTDNEAVEALRDTLASLKVYIDTQSPISDKGVE